MKKKKKSYLVVITLLIKVLAEVCIILFLLAFILTESPFKANIITKF